MCSKEELNHMLDQIPAEYPYEVVQNLKDLHHELHLAQSHDQQIAFLANANMTDDEIRHMAKEIGKPTHHATALKIFDKLSYVPIFKNGTGKVLSIAMQIYLVHNPPNIINHSE